VFTSVLVLLLGVLVIPILDRLIAARRLGFSALLIAGGALLSLLLPGGKSPSSLVLSPWRPLMESELAFKIDGLAFVFAVSMLLLGLTSFSLSLGDEGVEARLYVARLILLAAGLSFVFSADLLTLCFSWIFLEFALVLTEATSSVRRPHAERMAQVLGVLALMMAAFLLDSGLPFQTFLALAVLIRIGIYPLRLWKLAEARSQALPYLISTGSGLYLLVRTQPSSGLLTALGLMAFLIGSMLAWLEGGSPRFVAISQVGYAVLVGSVARPLAAAVNLLLCLGLLFGQDRPEAAGQLREGVRGEPWQRAPLALALVSLIGLPFTLGFVSRWLLYNALPPQSLWILVLSLLAEVMLSASLLRRWLASSPGRLPAAHWAGVAFLAVPLLLFGFFPPLIREGALPDLFHSAEAALWAILLSPPLGGYVLHRWCKVPAPLSARLSSLLELDWLYEPLGRLLGNAEAIFLGIGRAIEGRSYVGWALLAVFLFLLFLW